MLQDQNVCICGKFLPLTASLSFGFIQAGRLTPVYGGLNFLIDEADEICSRGSAFSRKEKQNEQIRSERKAETALSGNA